jgi:hypothetical protein
VDHGRIEVADANAPLSGSLLLPTEEGCLVSRSTDGATPLDGGDEIRVGGDGLWVDAWSASGLCLLISRDVRVEPTTGVIADASVHARPLL